MDDVVNVAEVVVDVVAVVVVVAVVIIRVGVGIGWGGGRVVCGMVAVRDGRWDHR